MTGNLSRFSIGNKILFGFFILILFYLVIGLYSYSNMNELSALTEQVVPLSSRSDSLQKLENSQDSLEEHIDKLFKFGYKEDQDAANYHLEEMFSIIMSLEKNADNNSILKFQEK